MSEGSTGRLRATGPKVNDFRIRFGRCSVLGVGLFLGVSGRVSVADSCGCLRVSGSVKFEL